MLNCTQRVGLNSSLAPFPRSRCAGVDNLRITRCAKIRENPRKSAKIRGMTKKISMGSVQDNRKISYVVYTSFVLVSNRNFSSGIAGTAPGDSSHRTSARTAMRTHTCILLMLVLHQAMVSTSANPKSAGGPMTLISVDKSSLRVRMKK